MNQVILTGRLVKDIELRKTSDGKSCCMFSIAVARDKENADFINVVAFERRAEVLNQYTHKGSKILVNGCLRVRKYESNGQTKYATEVLANQIELIDSKQQTEQPTQPQPQEQTQSQPSNPYFANISGDELPF